MCVQKVLRLKLYLPKPNGIINETFIFFNVVQLVFHILIPVSFPPVKTSLNLVHCSMKLH